MDLNRAYHEMLRAGEDWADKQAAAQLLEETAKSVLADVVTRLMEDMSGAAAERIARGEPDYRQHVANMVEARRLANRARVNYDSKRTWLDLWRTGQATQRAEMQLAGTQR